MSLQNYLYLDHRSRAPTDMDVCLAILSLNNFNLGTRLSADFTCNNRHGIARLITISTNFTSTIIRQNAKHWQLEY